MYSVGVVSLGCSKNRVDTELMLGILRKAGYRITADEREADILIVNTCGFIEPAKQESIDTLLSLARYKQEGRLKLLAATGCLTQRYEQAILQDMPEVDLVLGVSQYPMLPRAIEEALAGKRPSYCAPEASVLCGERVLTTAPYTAYVRIADGCDNRCAYCAIPLIRGGFRSRDMQSVLDEIRALAEQGVKEHVLVAQDTSRFGMDTHGRSLLPELMVRAADIPGVEWLRVLYCYPDEVDDTLLEAMASRPNICRYLDLPLQHADPQLLRRMNRRGDIEQTRAFLKKAREMGFTLRTTFITGFPGEPPVKPGISVADFYTAMFACMGAMFAIYNRDVVGTGEGQMIDCCLTESMLRLQESIIAEYSYDGTIRTRIGNGTLVTVPSGHFLTKDGKYLVLSVSGDKLFKQWCESMGRPELAAVEDYKTGAGRTANREEINAICAEWAREHTIEECLEVLGDDIPNCPVYNVADIMQDEHFKARNAIVDVDTEQFGTLKMQNCVPKMYGTPGEIKWAGAPLGKFNEEVYGEKLGLTPEDLAKLKEEGVI